MHCDEGCQADLCIIKTIDGFMRRGIELVSDMMNYTGQECLFMLMFVDKTVQFCNPKLLSGLGQGREYR